MQHFFFCLHKLIETKGRKEMATFTLKNLIRKIEALFTSVFTSVRYSFALIAIDECEYDWNKNIDDLRNERLRC